MKTAEEAHGLKEIGKALVERGATVPGELFVVFRRDQSLIVKMEGWPDTRAETPEEKRELRESIRQLLEMELIKRTDPNIDEGLWLRKK